MKKLATILIALTLLNTAFAQEEDQKRKERKNRGTSYTMNFDIGMNNYLEEGGKSPEENNELYAVKPWGSWFFAINSVNRTHVTGPFYLQWGGSLSWYNFKFQDESVSISKDNTSVLFDHDPRTDIIPEKSKLTATYLNASFVPTLNFGAHKRGYNRFSRFHRDKRDGFRIGAGGYAGYKLASHSKFVYSKEGSKQKDKNKDSFYLNNWRYGVRLQLGFRDVDLFVNYDLNNLYADGKGPKLNAFSFGITI